MEKYDFCFEKYDASHSNHSKKLYLGMNSDIYILSYIDLCAGF